MTDRSDIRLFAAMAKGKPLGELEKCPVCQELDWTGIHECKPEWEVVRKYEGYDIDPDEDFETIRADDADMAARRLADLRYSDWDYPGHVEIWVRENFESAWQKFELDIERVPSFSVSRKED